MRGDASAVGSCRRRAVRGVAGSGLQPEAAADGRAFSIMPGQKGAVFHELFVFCRLPSKPAHVEQIVFEAYR